jgi:hypothetical protein
VVTFVCVARVDTRTSRSRNVPLPGLQTRSSAVSNELVPVVARKINAIPSERGVSSNFSVEKCDLAQRKHKSLTGEVSTLH